VVFLLATMRTAAWTRRGLASLGARTIPWLAARPIQYLPNEPVHMAGLPLLLPSHRLAWPAPCAKDVPQPAPAPIFGGLIGVALDLPSVDGVLLVDIEDGGLPVVEIEAKGKKGKRTFQPNVLHRKRTHGILTRLQTPGGRDVINRRRLKGRWKIGVS